MASKRRATKSDDKTPLTGFKINPNPQPPEWYSYREVQVVQPWLAENQYLTTGYMPPTDSVLLSIRRLFTLSNQWGNFWSHSLGFVGAAVYMGYGWYTDMGTAPWEAQLAYLGFCFGGLFCLGASSIFHGFGHMRHSVFHNTLVCDFTGIAILISTSYLPMLWNMFSCWADLRTLYLGILVFMTIAQLLAPFMVSIISDENIILRVVLYSSTAIFGFVPSFHLMRLIGYEHMAEVCNGLFTMYGLYGVGVLLYVTRYPEKLSPGSFDVFGHSHTLFHICVALAVYQHTANVLRAYRWGLEHDDVYECHGLQTRPLMSLGEAVCGMPWVTPICNMF